MHVDADRYWNTGAMSSGDAIARLAFILELSSIVVNV